MISKRACKQRKSWNGSKQKSSRLSIAMTLFRLHDFPRVPTSQSRHGKLRSRSIRLTKLVLSDDPPLIIPKSSDLWQDTVQRTLVMNKVAIRAEKRMSVCQAIWKFLTETLFDRTRPFASFGDESPQANLVERICFDKLIPDHCKSTHLNVTRLDI